MLIRLSLAFFAVLCFFSPAIAEEPATTLPPASATAYFHRIYEGKIAGKYTVRMDVKKIGNVLKGSYRYKGKSDRLNLDGTIDAFGKFTVNEYIGMDYSNPNATLSGAMTGDSMTGVWRMADGSGQLDFALRMISEVKLKPKKEVLQQAVGIYYLESVSGAAGGSTLFESVRKNGAWKSAGSSNSGGVRKGYKNPLSIKDLRFLNSTRITVDSALTVRFITGEAILLEVPFNEKGMLHQMGEAPESTVLDHVVERLFPSTTYIEEELYLAALQPVDYSNALPSDIGDLIFIAYGTLVLSYSPKSRSFQVHIASPVFDNNILVFSKLARKK